MFNVAGQEIAKLDSPTWKLDTDVFGHLVNTGFSPPDVRTEENVNNATCGLSV